MLFNAQTTETTTRAHYSPYSVLLGNCADWPRTNAEKALTDIPLRNSAFAMPLRIDKLCQ